MTTAPWNTLPVSVVVPLRLPLVYEEKAWKRSIRSILEQQGSLNELILCSAGKSDADAHHHLVSETRRAAVNCEPNINVLSFLNEGELPAGRTSRSTALETGLQKATGRYVLLILGDDAPVVLKRVCLTTMLMAATRDPNTGMVYSDYANRVSDGRLNERHLLEYHEGRLRETADIGRVWLIDRDRANEAGGVNAADGAADLYGLRLRMSERSRVIHVGASKSGSLYHVEAANEDHDVFDYLRDEKLAQQQYERVLTDHLDRVGAILSPTRRFSSLSYSVEEEQSFDQCVASVVIPVFHRPEFIGSAIESVLTQTVRNVEVIVVVNGGEDDPTCNEVRRYIEGGDRFDADAPAVWLKIVDVNNIGMCLNVGLASARGKYYVQLDSDDRLKPDAIQKILDVFDSNPEMGMVIGSYEVWELNRESGEITRCEDLPVVTHDEWTDENGPNNLLRVNGAGAPRSAAIKAIKEVGWFGINDSPDARNYGEDYDLVLRMSERFRIGRVWDPIYEVIRHDGGTDHTIDQVTIDRNEQAKDGMRLEALLRRKKMNAQTEERMPTGDS